MLRREIKHVRQREEMLDIVERRGSMKYSDTMKCIKSIYHFHQPHMCLGKVKDAYNNKQGHGITPIHANCWLS